jgi:hypothetical protein
MTNNATHATKSIGTHRKRRLRLLPVGPRILSDIVRLPSVEISLSGPRRNAGFTTLKSRKRHAYRLIAPSSPYGGYPTAGEAITPTPWL